MRRTGRTSAAAHKLQSSRDDLVKSVRKQLEVVHQVIAKPPKERYSFYSRHDIPIAVGKSAEMIIKHFGGNIDNACNAFYQSTANTIHTFCGQVKNLTNPSNNTWRRYDELTSTKIQEYATKFRFSPEVREDIAKSFQRFIVMASKYTPTMPDIDDKYYLKYSDCCGCGAPAPYTGHTIEYVGNERPIPLPFCETCLDEPSLKVNWKNEAIMFLMYSVQLEQLVNDALGTAYRNPARSR